MASRGQGPLETLEEPLYVSSPLGIKAKIRMICQGCELEISGTLLTVDLRLMDMSAFDVILGMDWLTAYRIVIDCECKTREIPISSKRAKNRNFGKNLKCF